MALKPSDETKPLGEWVYSLMTPKINGVVSKTATNIVNYGQTVWGLELAQILFYPHSNLLSVHGTITPETWQRRMASLKLMEV